MAFYSFKISSISKPIDLILQCINDSFKTSNLVYIDILCAAAEPWYCVCEKLHIWASHIIVTCPIFHIFFITISMCVCVYIYMFWSIQTKGKQKGANIYAFLNIRACGAGWRRGSKNQPFDPLTPLVSIQYKPLILIWIVIKRQASTQAQFEHDAAWFMMNIWMYTGYKSWNAALVRARANILIYILNWRVFLVMDYFAELREKN